LVGSTAILPVDKSIRNIFPAQPNDAITNYLAPHFVLAY
jgi:hypothetical protein